jgi:hypothetical protein
MEVVVPWQPLIPSIDPHYPKVSKKAGRPPYPLRADSKCVTAILAGIASMCLGRLHCPFSVLQSFSAATYLCLTSHLKAIPEGRMCRGARIPAW